VNSVGGVTQPPTRPEVKQNKDSYGTILGQSYHLNIMVGNRIISRILGRSASNITMRSTPDPPPVGACRHRWHAEIFIHGLSFLHPRAAGFLFAQSLALIFGIVELGIRWPISMNAANGSSAPPNARIVTGELLLKGKFRADGPITNVGAPTNCGSTSEFEFSIPFTGAQVSPI